MQQHRRDLLIINGIALVMVALLLIGVDLPALRIVLALPLVLVVPGYALTAALFPAREFGPAEHIPLMVGFSLALAALGGVLLNWTPWGLQALSWAVLLLAVTLLASLVAVRRRREQSESAHDARAMFTVRQGALVVLALGIVIAAVNVTRTPTAPQGLQGYTQLWLLPADKKAQHTFTIGVRSMEFQDTTYELQLNAGDQILQQWSDLTLKPNDTWQKKVVISEDAARAGPLRALLFRADGPPWPPYRNVEWKSSQPK